MIKHDTVMVPLSSQINEISSNIYTKTVTKTLTNNTNQNKIKSQMSSSLAQKKARKSILINDINPFARDVKSRL